jgi:flagellar basal-body rod protein FlgB
MRTIHAVFARTGGKTGNRVAAGRQALAGHAYRRPFSAAPAHLARPLLIPRCAIRRRRRAMPNEGLFGVHGAALEVRSQRMGVLASNIANASTPGFKAQDVDFHTALAAVENATNTGGDVSIKGALQYRVPSQPSLDGNTVELSTEQTAFAENAVAYQTTLSFLNGRIGQITRALKGE